MNEIVKIEDFDGKQFVDARELHAALEVQTAFKDWIARRIDGYGFQEGEDFSSLMSESTGGRPGKDYRLSVTMAKELAMVENNEKGRAVRQYLINLEKAWNTPEMVMARALQCSQKTIENYRKSIAIMAPKAESFDALQKGNGVMSITDAAKYFGLHPKALVFPYLRECGYLTTKDLPTQAALDAGYLAQRISRCRDDEFRPQAVVLQNQLETWRTKVVPQIAAWEAKTK